MNRVHYGRYKGIEIIVSEGDILDSEVECIAVSGNPQGMMGGGVSAAVKAAAGESLQDEATECAPIVQGRTVILGPYALAAKGIKAVAYSAALEAIS